MKDTVDLAFEGAFYGEYALVIVHAFLGIGKDSGARVFLYGTVEDAIGRGTFFSKVGANLSQGRRSRSFHYTASVEYTVDLVWNCFVLLEVGEFVLDGRGALDVCFEEGVDSVEAFDHVLDDQEIFALEGSSLDFQSDQEGLDIFCS